MLGNKANTLIITLIIFLFSVVANAQTLDEALSCSVLVNGKFKRNYGNLKKNDKVSVKYEFTVPKNNNGNDIYLPLDNHPNSIEVYIDGDLVASKGEIGYIVVRDNHNTTLGKFDSIDIQLRRNIEGEIGGIEQGVTNKRNIGGMQLRTRDLTVLTSSEFITDDEAWNSLSTNIQDNGVLFYVGTRQPSPSRDVQPDDIVLSCTNRQESGCEALPIGVGTLVDDNLTEENNVFTQKCEYEINTDIDPASFYEASAKCPDDTTYIGGGYEKGLALESKELLIIKNTVSFDDQSNWHHRIGFSKGNTSSPLSLRILALCGK